MPKTLGRFSTRRQKHGLKKLEEIVPKIDNAWEDATKTTTIYNLSTVFWAACSHKSHEIRSVWFRSTKYRLDAANRGTYLKALEIFDTKNKIEERMSGFTKRSFYGFTAGPNWFSFPAPGFEHSHIWLFRNTWVRHTCWLHWFVICCIWILAHRICNAPFLTIAILTAKHVVLWCHILSQLIETVKKKFSICDITLKKTRFTTSESVWVLNIGDVSHVWKHTLPTETVDIPTKIMARDPKQCGGRKSMYQIQTTLTMEQQQVRPDMIVTAAPGPSM